DVFRLSDPTERRLRFQHFPNVAFYETAGYRSFSYYHSRIDGIDADFSWTEFLCQCARDRIDCAFRRFIDYRSGGSQRAGQRTNIDNASAVGVEMLERFLSYEKHPEHIGIKHFVELLLGHSFQWHPFVNAGIVDQNVDLAQGLFCLSEKSFNVCLLRDIRLHG